MVPANGNKVYKLTVNCLVLCHASFVQAAGVTVKHIPPRETIPTYLIQCLGI